MNEKNLIPIRHLSKEEAKKRGSNGGKKSAESKRKQKLMSQIYADILAEQTGQKKGLNLKQVVKNILQEGGSPAVSMLREIRESTEGTKNTFQNPDGSPLIPQKVIFEIVDPHDKNNTDRESISGDIKPGAV